jgi:uncharacterized OsmC-like protein
MEITARIINDAQRNDVQVSTNEVTKVLSIPSKAMGRGSSVNGGELLFLALATCFCNDIYREAAKRGLELRSVEVSVSGSFGAEGEPATGIRYEARVDTDAAPEAVRDLLVYVDEVAEVHNTLRKGVDLRLGGGQNTGLIG